MDLRVGETAVGVGATERCFIWPGCLETWRGFRVQVKVRLWKKVLQNETERCARNISQNGDSSGENSKKHPVFAKGRRLTKRHPSVISRELSGTLRKNWGKSADFRRTGRCRAMGCCEGWRGARVSVERADRGAGSGAVRGFLGSSAAGRTCGL
jgi:hypothetical protein